MHIFAMQKYINSFEGIQRHSKNTWVECRQSDVGILSRVFSAPGPLCPKEIDEHGR